MGIDWNRVKTRDDLTKIAGYDDSDIGELHLTINPNLSEWEMEDALFWRDYARGIILINGSPGQGKGMLAHMLAFKFNRYFGLQVVSDSRPRPLFGELVGGYAPFSEEFLVDQMDRQTEVATGRIIRDYEIWECEECGARREFKIGKNGYHKCQECKGLMGLAKEPEDIVQPHVTNDGKWISSRGEVFIHRAVWLLDEFGSKYMNRRNPHRPIQRTLLFDVFPQWRHLECVILGLTTDSDDLDPRYEPKMTAEIRCTRMIVEDKKGNPNPDRLVFRCNIYPKRYVGRGEYGFTGRKQTIILVGDKPQEIIGDKCWKDLYNTRQAIAIQAPKSMRRGQ